MKKKFNQIDYIKEYNKEHYKVFKVNLKDKEYQALEKYLMDHKISKATFLRNAMADKKIIDKQ